MRLLERLPTDDFQLVSFSDDDPPPYAILSHTWTAGQEVTYNELVAGTGKDKAGYAKIRFCGRRAVADGLQYFWIDTCCIDKSTSDELSTAINSMFRWYQRASRCYVYLSDVSVPEEAVDAEGFQIAWEDAFRRSRWFTRGWTLQELLAPASVEFFSKEGKRLGSRISLEREIHDTTKIPIGVLRGHPLSELSVDERMSWAAKRSTTIKEDKAYCLLGIFGVFMPLIYGEGEEHAYSRLRRKILKPSKGTEVRGNEHTQDNSLSLLIKPSSNVPFRRDDDFVDRGDILERIDERCSQPAGRAALVGFGGFGKSQLAIEYAHRVRKKSPKTWVFWIHASNSARLEAAFRDIAEKVGLPSQPTATVDALQSVRRWLCNEANGRWLLIVDNADTDVTIQMQKEEEKVSLAALLPQSDHGAILITSRNADVARSLVGRDKDIIPVGIMSNDEAAQLLENKLGDGPRVGVIQLAKALDCIPLAIVQAAAYINRLGPRMSITKYLDELGSVGKQARLLYKTAPDVRRDEQASNSVLMTWQISFDYIQQKRPSAAYLLSFMSFFNQQGIPEFMARHYVDNKDDQNLHDSLGGRLDEEDVDFEEDVAVLRAFSLVSITQRENEFKMHGLVQLATRIWLRSTDADKGWHQAFIKAMAYEFPDGEYANWPKCQTLFPHVLPVFGQDGSDGKNLDEWALLLNNASWYAWRQGLFAQAEDMVREALEIRKKALDAKGSSILLSMSLLGSILSDLGNYEEAETIIRQALARYENMFGPEYQGTLTSMNNLALVLSRQGKYEEAEAMNRQTLAQRDKVLGPEHPDTLMSMNNLATVLDNQGKYKEAELMNRQTLAQKEKVLGPEHPETLMTMSNLASVLNRQGKYEEAESMDRQTLAQKEKVLGPEHPDTLMTMNGLALVLNNQGKYKEAVLMNRQILVQREKVLGPEHPDTLITMNNLALALDNQGKYKEAESINRETLALREKALGPNHPSTLLAMSNLATVLVSQGKYEEAESMDRQTLAQREKVLGPKHPDTLITMNNLAIVLVSQGKYEEAELMHRQELAICTKVLGHEHPDTLTSMNNLATVLSCQGKYEEAESMNRQTFMQREKVLGPEHPDTLMSMYCLARLLSDQHHYNESLPLYERTYAAFCTVLGRDHPTTRACYKHHAEAKMDAAQEQC